MIEDFSLPDEPQPDRFAVLLMSSGKSRVVRMPGGGPWGFIREEVSRRYYDPETGDVSEPKVTVRSFEFQHWDDRGRGVYKQQTLERDIDGWRLISECDVSKL